MPASFEDSLKRNAYMEVAKVIKGARPLCPNIRNSSSQTPLMIVCQSKAFDTLECLLEHSELNLEEVDLEGKTAFLYAAECGFLQGKKCTANK